MLEMRIQLRSVMARGADLGTLAALQMYEVDASGGDGVDAGDIADGTVWAWPNNVVSLSKFPNSMQMLDAAYREVLSEAGAAQTARVTTGLARPVT
jgi:hypothetical protein